MGITLRHRLTRRVARGTAAGSSLLLGLGTFVALMATEPQSDSAAELLVRQAAANERTLAYEGDLAGEESWDGEAHHWRVFVQHHPSDWLHMEFREPEALRGEPVRGMVIVVRDGARYVSKPSDGRWMRGRSMDRDADADQLCRNYRASFGERGTVAGLPARMVSLDARWPGRPREVRWIAEAPPFVLKSERWDCQGRRMRSKAFASIQFGVRLDAARFRVPDVVAGEPEPKRLEADFPPVQPVWVPQGFRLVSARTWERHGQIGSSALYSDGMAIFALHVKPIETEADRAQWDAAHPVKPGHDTDSQGTARAGAKPEGKPAGERPERDGPSDTRAVVSWDDGRFRYLLTGDIAEVELQRVARSVPEVKWAARTPKAPAAGAKTAP